MSLTYVLERLDLLEEKVDRINTHLFEASESLHGYTLDDYVREIHRGMRRVAKQIVRVSTRLEMEIPTTDSEDEEEKDATDESTPRDENDEDAMGEPEGNEVEVAAPPAAAVPAVVAPVSGPLIKINKE